MYSLENPIRKALMIIEELEQNFQPTIGVDLCFLIPIDEAQSGSKKLHEILSLITNTYLDSSIHSLFVPILSGTNIAHLRSTTTNSGSIFELIQLPLLQKADYSEILNDLFPCNNFVTKREIQHALEDIEGPPRLLQVLLYESSECGIGKNGEGVASVLE